MPDYMTVGEVAKELGVVGETVRWWTRTGRLPATRTRSGVRLIDRRDVDAFIRARAERAGQIISNRSPRNDKPRGSDAGLSANRESTVVKPILPRKPRPVAVLVWTNRITAKPSSLVKAPEVSR